MKRLRSLIIALFLTVLFSTGIYSLDPRSGPLFHKSILDFCDFNCEAVKGNPKNGQGVLIYGKKAEGFGCLVVAVIENDCLIRVSLVANKKFPRGLTVGPINTAFVFLALSSGGNPPPDILAKQFRGVWDKIVYYWGKQDLINIDFNTGFYGIRVQVASTERDEAVKLYLR